ncbi:hypothetical protein ACWEN3_46450, partial [Streptomyces sp. NPDC004561]
STAPRMVQAPAQEALAMAGPSRRPEHSPPSAAPHRPSAAPPVGQRLPAPPRNRPGPHQPQDGDTAAPHLPRSLPKAPDLCALGKRYGGWRKDSPEAVICEEAYGR